MRLVVIFLSLIFAPTIFGQCNYAKHFIISYNSGEIYSTLYAQNSSLQMEYDTLRETDLIRVQYKECGTAPIADYELHLKVTNTTIDHTFVNDAPDFTLNMGWLTQYKNREVSFYIHFFDSKYTSNKSNPLILKVADIFIS